MTTATTSSMPSDYAQRAETYGLADSKTIASVLASSSLPSTSSSSSSSSSSQHEQAVVVVVDVRTDAEIADSGTWQPPHAKWHHVVGVTPTDPSPVVDIASELFGSSKKDTPIIMYCRSGRRVHGVQQALQQAGYTNVLNAGGYDDLIAMGLLTKEEETK